MSYLYRCEICGDSTPEKPDPRNYHWTIRRIGDAVVSWACDLHLADVMRKMIRERIAIGHKYQELVVTMRDVE